MQLPKGKSAPVWHDYPWTAAEVERAKAAGVFFVRGRHDFADAAAEEAALGKRPTKANSSIRKWLKQLNSEQLTILRTILERETA
jgi:hypothetical protein